jgi:hypothetical protein
MSTAQRIILLVSNLCLLTALIGLCVRRRLRLAYSFPTYLVAVLVLGSLSGLWPARFNTWSFYWFKQSVYSVLEMAVALELTVRVFQAFPAARRAARGAFLVVLAVTVIAVWSTPTATSPDARPQQQWADLVLSMFPRISNGTAWLFGALFALILYYRLPLHPLHKAIAFSFMAFLLLLTWGLDLVKRSNFARLSLVSYVGSLGFTLMTAYWAWVAWRRDTAPPADTGVVSRLQPWREDSPPDL